MRKGPGQQEKEEDVSSSTHRLLGPNIRYLYKNFFQTFEEVNLTHFHYTEWGVGVVDEEKEEGVPSATHGLLGLVEHALAHQEQASLTGPIAVHCRLVYSICSVIWYVLTSSFPFVISFSHFFSLFLSRFIPRDLINSLRI